MSSGDRWNGKCVLMAEAEDLDEMLRPQKVLKAVKSVFCKVVGVKQNEFYQAAAQGYKVELQLEVRKTSYDENKITHLKYGGIVRRILRSYPAKCAENVVLVCVDKANEARKQ